MLVVLYHTTLFLTAAEIVDDIWIDINAVFKTFRMPLFFFASGLFALSVIRRPWGRMWESRVALLVWAFALWSVIRFAFFNVVDSPLPLDETRLIGLMAAPLWPQTGLWFLHALAVFFVAAKLLTQLRVPVLLQLTMASAVSIPFFAGVTVGNISYNGMLQYFVFFLFACHFRETILPAVARWGVLTAVGSVGLFAAGYAAIRMTHTEAVPGAMFVLAIVALVAGLALARTLDRMPGAGRIAWLGKQTLPIYVAHVLFVGAMTAALLPVRDHPIVDAMRPVLPVLVMAAATAAALGLWLLSRNLPVLRYAYIAPNLVRFPVDSLRAIRPQRMTRKSEKAPVAG